MNTALHNISRHNNRGAVSTVVLIIIAIIIVGGAIFLSVSKPWSQWAKTAVENATEWTPENIQKDKLGYLSWAKDEMEKAQNKLEARAIALGAALEDAKQKKEKNALLSKANKNLLVSGMKAYKEAEAAGQWPDKWERLDVGSQEAFKQILLDTETRRANAERRVVVYEDYEQKIVTKLDEIKTERRKVSDFRKELEIKIEMIKTDQIINITEESRSNAQKIINTVKHITSTPITTPSDQEEREMQKERARASDDRFADLKTQFP